MSASRRAAVLILIGVAVLVLSAIVLIRNRSPDDELLAIVGLLGGFALIVGSLPYRHDD